MKARQRSVDPIPEEFAGYEEAAEFWDTHDTTDYPDAFRTVDMIAEFRRRLTATNNPRVSSGDRGNTRE